MKIFIDIGHPAHVHYFKNTIKILKSKGNEVFVSARDRYPVKELLDSEGIDFYNRGKGKDSKVGKLFYLIKADVDLLRIAKNIKPDLFICFGAVYLTHVAKIIGKPSIFIDDTDNARLNRRFYLPFATHILTPDVFNHDLGKKQIRFKGYMELSYLHPKVFTPSKEILNKVGLKEGDKFTIIRFVNWKANHDYHGHSGISMQNKIKAVEEFLKYGKVLITSESALPSELLKYSIKIAPEKLHHLMSFASLLYGESATMASESAVLGVPSVYIDNEGRCYTDDEEKSYNLVSNFSESNEDQLKSIEKGVDILKRNNLEYYRNQRERLLKDKISFTDYLTWIIENFPNSIKVLKNNTSFQLTFIK